MDVEGFTTRREFSALRESEDASQVCRKDVDDAVKARKDEKAQSFRRSVLSLDDI